MGKLTHDRRNISRNVASLKILAHDGINLLYHEHWTDKRKYFYVSVFTSNDLVLALRSSKVRTPNGFWQIFSFFTYFTIGQTFASTDWLFCPNSIVLSSLHGWPSLKSQVSLLGNDQISAAKNRKECTSNHFWEILQNRPKFCYFFLYKLYSLITINTITT